MTKEYVLSREPTGKWEVVKMGQCYYDLFDENGRWVMTDVEEDGKLAKFIAKCVNHCREKLGFKV